MRCLRYTGGYASNVVDIVYNNILGEVGNCCGTSVPAEYYFFLSKLLIVCLKCIKRLTCIIHAT